MKHTILFIAIHVGALGAYTASSISRQYSRSKLVVSMIGGRGWGNDDYLSSLGGSEEDKQQANEKYDEFKETREAFVLRQRERMNSPAAQKFMRELSSSQQMGSGIRAGNEGDGEETFFQDFGIPGGLPRGNESRFQNMMRQAAMKKMSSSNHLSNENNFPSMMEENDEDGEETARTRPE